jgi:hypothetical protein
MAQLTQHLALCGRELCHVPFRLLPESFTQGGKIAHKSLIEKNCAIMLNVWLTVRYVQYGNTKCVLMNFTDQIIIILTAKAGKTRQKKGGTSIDQIQVVNHKHRGSHQVLSSLKLHDQLCAATFSLSKCVQAFKYLLEPAFDCRDQWRPDSGLAQG